MVIKKDVCIIIPNLNNINLLDNCLKSIKKSTSKKINYKIVVVDDGSTKENFNWIKKNHKEVDLLRNEISQGFSKANNKGIKFAYQKYNPTYYYFLNNDTRVTKNWLKNLLDFAKNNKNIGALGSRQVGFNNEKNVYAADYHFVYTKYYFGENPRQVEWLCGAGFIVSREAILRCGLFDEVFTPGYYEESDWLQRICRKGYDVWVVPSSKIYHKIGSTKDGFFAKKKSYFYRNELIFYIRYYPFYFISKSFLSFLESMLCGFTPELFRAYLDGWKKRKDSEILYLS